MDEIIALCLVSIIFVIVEVYEDLSERNVLCDVM
jgi:hypothetical protein